MGKLNVVGIGPGSKEHMTFLAYETLISSDVIVGYTKYISLIKDEFPDKEFVSTGMGAEEERCRKALLLADENEDIVVSVVCSGDSVIYGMAGLIYELSAEYPNVSIRVIPGVSAVISGSALIGAGAGNDFSVISLSNYLTSKEDTYLRLENAVKSDMVTVLYNPNSRTRPNCLKEACEFLLEFTDKNRICAVAKNIGREGEEYTVCTLYELKDKDVDMFSTVFIGSSMTENINGHFVTRRGYRG